MRVSSPRCLAMSSRALSQSALPPVRRVVTGLAADGRSTHIDDALHDADQLGDGATGRFKARRTPYRGEADHQVLYTASSVPARIAEPFADPMRSAPPKLELPEGVVLRVRDVPPRSEGRAFHETRSLDVGIILSGSITSIQSDGSECVLKTGDVIVQRMTQHRWRNDTDHWTRIYFVLVGASSSPPTPLIGTGAEKGASSAAQ